MMTTPLDEEKVFKKDFVQETRGLSHSFKQLLKAWEKNFEKNFFKPPASSDKLLKKDWYSTYKKLHNAVVNLEHGNPPVGLSGDWGERLNNCVELFEEEVSKSTLSKLN